jgi:hypothetical protein
LASEAVTGMFLRFPSEPEIENPEDGTPVLPSHPLARDLVRALRLFGEYPRLVLHKRRAKYGGDWPMRRVELEKTSTLRITI